MELYNMSDKLIENYIYSEQYNIYSALLNRRPVRTVIEWADGTQEIIIGHKGHKTPFQMYRHYKKQCTLRLVGVSATL